MRPLTDNDFHHIQHHVVPAHDRIQIQTGQLQSSQLSPAQQLHSSGAHNLGSVPVSVSAMSTMYFPSFHDNNLALHINPYSYPEGTLDFNNFLGSSISLPQESLLDDGQAADTPCTAPSYAQQDQSEPSPRAYPRHLSPALSSPSQPPPSLFSPMHAPSQSPEIRPRHISLSLMPGTAPVNGHTHTMLPPMVHPNSSDPSMDLENRSFNQRVNSTCPSQPDPHAPAFLKDRLGEERWNILSARLFERRLGGGRTKSRGKGKSDAERNGATAIEFLVKVEIVKEVLRTYVPHPYNPLKSLTHPFEHCPSGYVTLTRSTVLALSGWSNTQFSYWARRAEALSVLGPHDERLSRVAAALERRLHGEKDEDDEDDGTGTVTGKGLDVIIDEVKKRTGLSQFLRGKHSSLDPFGAPVSEGEAGFEVPGQPAAVYMPTFQAMEYTHSLPTGFSPAAGPLGGRARTRKGSKADSSHSHQSSGTFDDAASSTLADDESISHLSFKHSESRTIDLPFEMTSPSVDLLPLPSSPVQSTLLSMPRNNRPNMAQTSPEMHHGRPGTADSSHSNNASSRRELFPLSDSRSEYEMAPQKREHDFVDTLPSKRGRYGDCRLP